jgi:hypothetical protein
MIKRKRTKRAAPAKPKRSRATATERGAYALRSELAELLDSVRNNKALRSVFI